MLAPGRRIRPPLLALTHSHGRRCAHSQSRSPLVVGIRREDKGRWERRVPLTPAHVQLLARDTRVIVQPSTRRVFADYEYQAAGATLSDDLTVADVVLGVKEVPIEQLLPNKRYAFFSHTHKGQRHNMPLLQAILDRNIHLMDYELMTAESGSRLVLFGKHAGYAGMINALHGLGIHLLGLGYSTPFLNIARAFNYNLLADANDAIRRVGEQVSAGLPNGPLVFTFTGDGNVSRGAQQVFKSLPHQFVKPGDLPKLMTDFDPRKVYGVVVTAKDYIESNSGSKNAVNMDEYFKHGSKRFKSTFHETILPYTSVLVNGIYWEKKYPRLVESKHLRDLAKSGRLRLLSVADISCDIDGSLEFVTRASTIDEPFFLLDPLTGAESAVKSDATGKVLMMTVDNLPAELAQESSNHFSESLFPLIQGLVHNKKDLVLERATIARGGKLTPSHQHLAQHLPKKSATTTPSDRQVILLLGSGRVARPLVDYFSRDDQNVKIIVASNQIQEASALASGRSNTVAKELDVGNESSLRQLIKSCDIVVSFVPATLHGKAARICVEEGKNMVTASYESAELASLNEAATKKGVLVLNELGLDPGIDHLLAMRFFDQMKKQGATIKSFVSWCGGLPAPEVSDNPLGYKFSWSPRGVLLASMNPAKFLRDGQVVEYKPGAILDNAQDVNIYRGFNFEGLANRDSLQYIDVYGLDRSQLDTMFRGTLRYKGFAQIMAKMRDLGLFDAGKQLTDKALLTASVGKGGNGVDIVATAKHLGCDEATVHNLMDLGLFSKVPAQSKSRLDALCDLLEKRLLYRNGESDMVCLHHTFGVETASGAHETHTSSLVAYGDPTGYSAMAKTVALPAAIGTDLILRGRIQQTGVKRPLTADIYEPILARLEREGLLFRESRA